MSLPTTRCVVIQRSALPRRFSAGLNLDILLGKSGLEVRRFLERLYVGLTNAQDGVGKPTIAAVNGAERGGGMTLAISCDVILAAERGSFCYPAVFQFSRAPCRGRPDRSRHVPEVPSRRLPSASDA